MPAGPMEGFEVLLAWPKFSLVFPLEAARRLRRARDRCQFGVLGNLSTPKSVQKLQMALHAKAKAEAGYRFYALYDKISREDILAHAYAQCRSNKGAPGVGGQTFADVEAYGVERWLGELALALRQETYRPDPIRRVYIAKANGKLRPLGISTLRDRVCMTAAMLVLEPIFEADLPPEQYAYRPGRSAQQAVVEVEGLLFRGHPEVVDADLADYFGSIPHAELLKSVARRIVDRRVLHLIKMWLVCPWKKPTIEEGRGARPRPRTSGVAFRKVHRSHRCWQICTCAGLCWDGRSSGWSEASALAS